jgi:hypothetical protein
VIGGGGGGAFAQRAVLHVKEPKKTGAYSARGRSAAKTVIVKLLAASI